MAYGHPSGPAVNLWPHLIYSSLERFRKFKKKVTDRRTDTHTDTHTDAPTTVGVDT